MNPPDINDPLDALLREENAYIEDNGFTARVMAALPARHQRAWLRPTLLLGATTIGYVLAVWWVPWDLVNSASLLSFNSHALPAYALLLAIVGSLLSGVIAALGWAE
jgi:hypothetical protein